LCGSSFEEVLILVNGLRANDPQTGHFNMDILTWKDIFLNLHLEQQLSDGYMKNTDFNAKLGNLSLNSKNWQILIGFSDKKFGANSFYSSKYPKEWEHTKTWLLF